MRSLSSPLDGIVSPFGARRGWSPLSLFANGEAGLYYLPDVGTLLAQDAAATTPVTAAGQAVGFQPDKSKGLVPGSELLPDPTLDNAANWMASAASLVVTGGAAVWTAAASGVNLQPAAGLTPVANRSYYAEVTIASISGGALRIGNEAGNALSPDFTTTGKKTFVFTAPSTSKITLRAVGTTTASVSDYSIRELLGNHAVLSGANTLRPLYQITPARLVFDATDDRLLTALNPTTSGTIAARIKGGTASKVALGSQGAANGKAFLALAADGSLGAGIGADSTSTIKGSADIRAAWATGVVTWDGSTVKLYQDGAQVYSGAQNGAVNTTVPWMFGCLNNNATAASFWDGSIGAAIVLNRVMTPSEVVSLNTYWSTIQ